MAYVLHRPGHQLPVNVASAVNPRQPVQLLGTSALICGPVATSNVEPFGYAGEATAAVGETLTVYEALNIVKAVAAASLGVNAAVTVASTNGALGPAVIVASGHYEHGKSLTPAAAGEVFSLYVRPRKAA